METRDWERIFSLSDRSVFLGNCCTFSVVAADYHGCIPNCIYFIDDEFHCFQETGGLDTGLYNCDTKEVIRPDPPWEGEPGFRSKFSPPLWILPSSH